MASPNAPSIQTSMDALTIDFSLPKIDLDSIINIDLEADTFCLTSQKN
jgi:hypothetical protein